MTSPVDSSYTARVDQDEVLHESEDEVPHAGVEYEVLQGGGQDKVRQEEGENKVPHAVESEATTGDQLNEDPNLVEEAGPSGVQPPEVVHQAVCGGYAPPELCEYEKLRERNIRERDEAMKEAMEEIEESKQDLRDNAPGAKKRAPEEEAGGEEEEGGDSG